MPVIMVEGRQKQVEKGTTFEALAKEYQERYPEKITLVVFNSKMQELSKRVEKDGVLTFLTVKDDSGHKTYCRTAQMMLVKAVRDILGNEAKVNIEFLLGNGYYCFVRGTDAPIDDALAAKVEARMREMQQQDLPITKKTYPRDTAIEMFSRQGMDDKVKLFHYRRGSTINVYCLDGYYDYGCIRFDNEEDMIRFYEANREELDYRNERYEKIESAYSADGRTSAEVLSMQLPVSYAESLMSIDKQRDLDNDEVFIVNHSQEERERLRYVEGEFFEDYLKRNQLDRREPESLLYFHDKLTEEQWSEIDHIFRSGMTKDNAQETGEKIAALNYVSSKQEGYSLMGLLRHIQPDAILPYLDGVSAAFNKLGPERSELKKKYDTLKEKHPDALLLFRGGDFYETYEKDAKTASDILGITITWSDNDKAHNLETYEGAMAAFPHYALDTYLPKLVRAGQRVAICDLLEDPKNLVSNVKRDITMLVDRHADVRLQVVGNEEDMKHVLPHDAMLRDALIERLRAAGIPVVTDAAVAENVLMNGNLVRELKVEDWKVFDERMAKIQAEYSSLIEVLPVRYENAEKAFNDYRMELTGKYGEDFNNKITEEEDVRLSTLQGEMWKLEPEIDGYDSIAFRMLAESHGWNFMIGFDYYDGALRVKDQLAAEYALGVRQPMDDKQRQAVEQTESFKQWFGDWQNDADRASKVIGSDGRPMVLYHGTGVENAFSIFDRAKAGRSNDMAAIGFWFTPSSDFAQRWTEEVWYAGRMGGYAIPVYLDIKNPKIYRPLGEEQKAESERLLEQLRDVRAEMKEIHDKYNYVNFGYKDIEAFHIGCRNGFVYNPSDNYSIYYSPEAAERQREYYATRTENGRQAIEDGERYYQLSEQERMLEDKYNSLAFGDSYEQFKIDFYVHAGMRPGDACIGGLGMALRDPQTARETFRDYLKSQGYDGIIIEDTKYDRRMAGTEANTQYIVFEPEQIKSAIENNGEFLRENPDIRYFRNGDHEVYGFVNNGTIYVDPRIATAETPIHEYTHLWAEVLRVNNRDEWKNIVQMMKDTPEVWNEVRRLYPWIKDENQIAEEALARYSGHRGYERLMALVDDEPGNRNILDKMLEALDKFWHAVADFLHIHYTSKEQVADQVLHDLLSGVNPLDYRQVNSRSFKEWFGDWKTASLVKQLDIVHMQDDYDNFKRSLPKISREAREVYDEFAFDMGSKYGFDWLEKLSVEEREEEHRLYDYRDKYDLDENDPDELAFEMLSERYPSELLALVGHSNGRLYPLYDEEEISEVSKMVHEDGTPMVVYHGSSWDPLSEAAGEAVFDDSYRGVASQDNGFFGRGFYFTFGNGDLSKQEAAYYGSKVGEYFLNIRRPFMFHETLGTLNGFDPIGDEKNTVGVINMVRHFPELVKDYRLSTYDGFGEYSGEISLEEFMKIKGIGKVKAIQLKAVCELALRMSKPTNYKKITVKEPYDLAKILMNELRFEKREIAKIVVLNNKNIILKIKDIAYGGSNFANLSIKDILVEPIVMKAPKIILVHNHPSGDSTPSKQDIDFTMKLYESATIFNIELLDHIVIGDMQFTSIFSEVFKDENNLR